jgi:hypothetical protein
VRANPQDAQLLKSRLSGAGGLNDTSFLQHIDRQLAHPFLVGFSDAMDLVFAVGACVLVLAFVLALFLKEVPLRTQSGLQAAQAARAAAAAEDPDVAVAGGATHEPEAVRPTLSR